MKVLYNLPKKIKFCKKCVMSNQRPSSFPEYKHKFDRKGAKYLNFDNSGFPLCGLVNYNLVNQPHLKGKKTISNYVENDINSLSDEGFSNIIKDFESEEHPGKHDGQKLLDEIVSLYQGRD